jgi:F-type H+-transporting ATPase subunit a
MSMNAVDAALLLQQKTDAVQAYVLHHVTDSHLLKLPFLKPIALPGFLSVHGVMIVMGAFLLILVCGLAARRKAAVPTGMANAIELFVTLIRDQVVVPYLGPEDGRRMTPLFCSFFFFILALNLIGLVPCFYTATANLSVTGALAAISLGLMIIGATFKTGVMGFFKGFIPHGVPWPVLIVLVPIEIVGVFIKAFALMIRLFANELAGHIVMLFMVGLLVIFGLPALPFFVLAIGIYILELGVAFLQAYIFTLLSAIFIGQRYHPEH